MIPASVVHLKDKVSSRTTAVAVTVVLIAAALTGLAARLHQVQQTHADTAAALRQEQRQELQEEVQQAHVDTAAALRQELRQELREEVQQVQQAHVDTAAALREEVQQVQNLRSMGDLRDVLDRVPRSSDISRHIHRYLAYDQTTALVARLDPRLVDEVTVGPGASGRVVLRSTDVIANRPAQVTVLVGDQVNETPFAYDVETPATYGVVYRVTDADGGLVDVPRYLRAVAPPAESSETPPDPVRMSTHTWMALRPYRGDVVDAAAGSCANGCGAGCVGNCVRIRHDDVRGATAVSMTIGATTYLDGHVIRSDIPDEVVVAYRHTTDDGILGILSRHVRFYEPPRVAFRTSHGIPSSTAAPRLELPGDAAEWGGGVGDLGLAVVVDGTPVAPTRDAGGGATYVYTFPRSGTRRIVYRVTDARSQSVETHLDVTYVPVVRLVEGLSSVYTNLTVPMIVDAKNVVMDGSDEAYSVRISVVRDGVEYGVGDGVSSHAIDVLRAETTLVRYTVTDASDHVTVLDRTVTYQDVIPPSIRLADGVPSHLVTHDARSTLSRADVVVVDDDHSSDGSGMDVQILESGTTLALDEGGQTTLEFTCSGERRVTYRTRDRAGNAATLDRVIRYVPQVRLRDGLAKNTVVHDPANYSIEADDVHLVNSDEPYLVRATVGSDVPVVNFTDLSGSGIYMRVPTVAAKPGTVVRYEVTDASGNTTLIQRVVVYVDVVYPVVSLATGVAAMTVTSAPFVDVRLSDVTVDDPTATTAVLVDDVAVDDLEDAPTATTTLRFMESGTKRITYRATDPSGNSAAVIRTVQYVPDVVLVRDLPRFHVGTFAPSATDVVADTGEQLVVTISSTPREDDATTLTHTYAVVDMSKNETTLTHETTYVQAMIDTMVTAAADAATATEVVVRTVDVTIDATLIIEEITMHVIEETATFSGPDAYGDVYINSKAAFPNAVDGHTINESGAHVIKYVIKWDDGTYTVVERVATIA